MSEIVAAFGSSHSAMQNATRQDWLARFDYVDVKVPVVDADGDPLSYDALKSRAEPLMATLMAPAAIAQRYDATMAAMDRLQDAITANRLDALIVVGDDQREIFKDACRPAIGVYYGDTIRNAAAPGPAPPGDFYRAAVYRRMEEGSDVHYPCDSALARHLVEGLCNAGFDITAVKDLVGEQFEGHAFSFLHRRYLRGSATRMVPIFLNTYYPPNQPTPARCLALGRAIRALVRSFPAAQRVGILASGGLSHYLVDEAFDQSVIAALRRKDENFLGALSPRRLQSGTSEIRNWICVAAAAADLELRSIDYVPAYRSSALTGVGLCFAHWA
jgi:hypothetical protein